MTLEKQLLLEGQLHLPNYQGFVQAIGQADADTASSFFKSLWHAYLKDKGTVSLPYWSAKFTTQANFNIVLKSLTKGNWINSSVIPARNWAEAQLNEDRLLAIATPDELERTRANKKFMQYILQHDLSSKTKATRLNGKTTNTGLVREGFMLAGNTEFSYDQTMMAEYQPIIQANLTKSMDKIADLCPNLRHDKASYDTISVAILDYHLHSDQTFTRGDNYNDSRGRAISSSLSKVANPISCKDFRALLVIE